MKRVLMMLLAMALVLSAPALAEADLTVSGTGVVSVTADRATVVLGVRETSEDVLTAQRTVNEKISAIYEALLALGVEQKDVGTESLYIYANYDYSGEEERIVGYTATNTLSISTAQLDQLGSYIDAAFAAGANTLDNVRFFAQDTQSAQQEALTLAVQNAREKAETIAAASGMKLGGIVSIDENQNHYGYDATAKYSNARAEDTVAAGATMVQASTLQVSASVVMEFMLTEGE